MDTGLKILLADDERIVRTLIRRAIGNSKHEIIECEDGEQAQALILQGGIDIALLDVTMPAIDGFSVARKTREKFGFDELPILFITGRTDDKDLVQGFQAGGNDYIHKPINAAVLRARLDAQIRLLETRRLFEAAQANISKMKRLEALGTLATAIAHNFNNILGTVLGSAELIRLKSTDQESDIAECADLITSASRRGAQLVEELLTFAKHSADGFCPTPSAVVENAIGVLSPGVSSAVRIEFSPEPDLPPLAIDSHSLAQIFVELLKNSLEALPKQGGLIKIHGRYLPDPNVVLFSVRDNGRGIPHEIREHIFEPFVSSKNRDQRFGIALDGSGMGLSVVFNLVSKSGGYMEPPHTGTEGTTMNFALPVHSPKIPESESRELLI